MRNFQDHGVNVGCLLARKESAVWLKWVHRKHWWMIGSRGLGDSNSVLSWLIQLGVHYMVNGGLNPFKNTDQICLPHQSRHARQHGMQMGIYILFNNAITSYYHLQIYTSQDSNRLWQNKIEWSNTTAQTTHTHTHHVWCGKTQHTSIICVQQGDALCTPPAPTQLFRKTHEQMNVAPSEHNHSSQSSISAGWGHTRIHMDFQSGAWKSFHRSESFASQ